MRFLIILISCSFLAFANDDYEKTLKEMELRIKRLEMQKDGSGGIKVKDYDGAASHQGGQARGLASDNNAPQISAEQQAEMEATIEAFKLKQQEHQKILDELMLEP